MKLREIRSKYSPSKMTSNNKHSSPVKVTLGMIKGKSIAMSVPVIKYHASDDELEEFYPSTDEEKRLTPDSEKTPSKSNRKNRNSFGNDDIDSVGSSGLERRSNSMDENLSETPKESDPWKVLTDIKGKITGKLLDIKNEKKKSKKSSEHKSRDTSSVSDYEELAGDVTPAEDVQSEKTEKQDKKTPSPTVRKRTRSSRFSGFSFIKTGLKVKKAKEEEEIEAAEVALAEQPKSDDSSLVTNESFEENQKISEYDKKKYALSNFQENIKQFMPEPFNSPTLIHLEAERAFLQLKNHIFYQFVGLIVLLCSFYFIPLPKYLMGILVGILFSSICKKIYNNVNELLTLTLPTAKRKETIVPIIEIPGVKEERPVTPKFEGWLNEYPYDYKPDSYHVARTIPVFLILEGDNLQIMETRSRIPKRAVWDEPKHKPKFTKKRVYCMAGAKVDLLPKGLIRRRRWSKKYPICITVASDTLKECMFIDNSSDEENQPLDSDDKIIMEEDETDDEISQSKDSRDIFEDCRDEEDEDQTKLYIFARTDRLKEDWFRRLKIAAEQVESKRSSISSTKDLPSPVSIEPKNSIPSTALSESSPTLSYDSYMARYIEILTTPTSESASLPHNIADSNWVNAMFGRILFDMHRCPDCINVIQDKIQRKLSNIKLPYFMESLSVSEIVIGQGAPIIHSATKPTLDEQGLWFDLEISYEGCLTMTIETKLNLMKLKRNDSMKSQYCEAEVVEKIQPVRSPMFDSDIEDSPETSTEDEDSFHLPTPTSSKDNTPTQSSGRKFLSMVDKLASNKYFQHATELSYIKRAMEGVSNTEIRLMVSLSSIEGCLAVNIPQPPTDRIWYGFRPIPRINLTAKPAVGERSFNIVYVTKWIEAKLLREFEKVVVIPNMDDLLIPLCPNYPFGP